MSNYGPNVAKYGGSSAAEPERIFEQDMHPANQTPIMVISAPGSDDIFPIKLTEMLLQGGGVSAAQQRFAHIADRLDPAAQNDELQTVLREIPQDFEAWEQRGHDIDALGEYWSAKMYAAYSSREFVDAAELIKLDHDGQVDLTASCRAIRQRLDPRRQYIIPGYYGADPDGINRTIGRGGSDTTGAILAAALGSEYYYNHTDTNGLLSGTPGIVENSVLRPHVTLREGRELALAGCPLISADSYLYLAGTGIKTVICNTFGKPGNRGTLLTEKRDWKANPIAAVTARDDLLALRLHKTGLDPEVGGTRALYNLLAEAGVPYEFATTGADSVTLYAAQKWREGMEFVADDLSHRTGNKISLHDQGSLHVVGEGLARNGILRNEVLGTLCIAMARAGIKNRGDANSSGSVGIALFVHPESLNKETRNNPLRIAHDALAHFLHEPV